MVTVLKSGLLTVPQDGGRTGFAHLGIGRSGAFDIAAFRLANALAGNSPDACTLELTLLGPTLRFQCDTRIAITGAPLPVSIESRMASMWSPLTVRAGQTLALGAMRNGCRAYLAVHGGFEFEPVLGSRSLDVNAALGPMERPLRGGDTLRIRKMAGAKLEMKSNWSIDPRPWFDDDARTPLRLLPGSHTHLLDDDSREALFVQVFRVGNDSNRVGLRLHGAPLRLAKPVEMISEACIAGTLQLPSSGEPIVLGAEHPVSGGYPRIGQIAAADLPRLAQRRPGDALRFRSCALDEAQRALHERGAQLREMERVISDRLKQLD